MLIPHDFYPLQNQHLAKFLAVTPLEATLTQNAGGGVRPMQTQRDTFAERRCFNSEFRIADIVLEISSFAFRLSRRGLPVRARQQGMHRRRNLVDMRFQREVSRLQELHRRARNVPLVRFRTGRDEEWIILAPDR